MDVPHQALGIQIVEVRDPADLPFVTTAITQQERPGFALSIQPSPAKLRKQFVPKIDGDLHERILAPQPTPPTKE